MGVQTMKLSINEVNNILKTLPIGYYAGTGVEVCCDEGNACYFDHHDNHIHIGYDIVNAALANVTDESKIDEETAVRTVLYHEVSHMVLTDAYTIEHWCNRSDFNIMNIFEDERIETLLRNYYMRTNFKTFVKLVNNAKETDEALTAESFFYSIVRYRKGPEQFVKMVDEIIEKSKYIKPNSGPYRTTKQGYYTSYEYIQSVLNFYKMVKEFFEQNKENIEKEQNQQNEENDKNNENNNEEQNSSESESNNQNAEDNNESENENTNQDRGGRYENSSDGDPDNSESTKYDDVEQSDDGEISNEGEMLSNEELDELFGTFFGGHKNTKMIENFKQIFKQFNKRGNVGGHSTGYSGIINPRNIARDDYKYFDRVANTNNNGAAAMHLNLWIDVSGSYKCNETTTNQIIYALEAVEKENKVFSFDVIAVSHGHKILEKTKRYITAGGCNYLDTQLDSDFKKMQKPNARNYNIVLFDGQCYTSNRDALNLRAFNHDNVFIISDQENFSALNRYCKKPHKVYQASRCSEKYKSYSEMLEEKINDVLRVAFGA